MLQGTVFAGPREFGEILLDRELSYDIFYDCQTTRFYNFALGYSQGVVGLQAGGGVAPDPVEADTIEKYRSGFEHTDWNVRELLRTLFYGDEFLMSQQGGA